MLLQYLRAIYYDPHPTDDIKYVYIFFNSNNLNLISNIPWDNLLNAQVKAIFNNYYSIYV